MCVLIRLPHMSLPVWVILLIVGLEPLYQLGVDGKGVLAVGEGVPHLKVYLLGPQLKGDKWCETMIRSE